MDVQKCFVICPIGDEGTDTRNRSDEVFRYVIQPVALENGYDAIRADHIDKPGSITTQIIEQILTAPLVIADLTGQNPNVFYELALRHAIRKPVVQIIQKGERLPFDVATQRTIELDHKSLGSAEEAKRRLDIQIKEVQKDPSQVDSPLAAGLQILDLQQSTKPIDKTLAEILLRLEELNQLVRSPGRPIPETAEINGLEEILNWVNRSNPNRATADVLADPKLGLGWYIKQAVREASKEHPVKTNNARSKGKN